ncbi:MAG: CBS domain-containing protein [Paracoccus sp. (in: a-proteobacteria)]
MLVNQILSLKGSGGAEVVTVASTATVADAAKLLAEKRIGAVVVSDDGRKPVGILSERDIVRELGRQGAGILSQPISKLMTRKVSTCGTGEDTLAVLERMTEGRFRHLPVVDDDGNMLGVVSIGDAVSARLKELSAEKEALTGMIMGS